MASARKTPEAMPCSGPMALTLHHLERSRSHRILWLFEELGLDYDLKEYRRHPETFRADPALREIHPLGKAPIVTDGDLVVAETGRVIEYVLEAHGEGRLQPEAGTEAHHRYRYYLHYAEGSLMPPLLVRLIFDKMLEARLPFFIKPVVKTIVRKVEDNFIFGEMELHGDFLDAELSDREWIAGDEFTAADIQLSYPVEALLTRGGRPPEKTRNLRAYAERFRARPAYERAVEKGGKVL